MSTDRATSPFFVIRDCPCSFCTLEVSTPLTQEYDGIDQHIIRLNETVRVFRQKLLDAGLLVPEAP